MESDVIQSKWNEIKEGVKREFDLTDMVYTTWIAPLSYISLEDGKANIAVPKELAQMGVGYLTKRYAAPFRVAIYEYTQISCDPVFVSEEHAKRIAPKKDILEEFHEIKDSDTNLSKKFTFESFVVGSNNNFAHAAALAVAESPGEIYNPLYIYGGPGLGKTHLIQAVGNYILAEDYTKKVLYVTAEDFTNEIINAIRAGNANSLVKFREKYRTVDVLIIDDIQFIAGKSSTQEEFFHTFNELQSRNKQIIITSDKPPRDLDNMEERMKSRFVMGVAADVSVPNYETRMAILKKKSADFDFELSEEIYHFMAMNIKASIRELEGALHKLYAYQRLVGEAITYEVAEKVLESIITDQTSEKIGAQNIMEMVAAQFDVTLEQMMSSTRVRKVSIPRQVVMYLCKELTDLTYDGIAAYLGNRDHATISHGISEIAKKYETDEELRKKIDTIKKMLG